MPEAAEAFEVQAALFGGEASLRALLAATGTRWQDRHPFVDRLVRNMAPSSGPVASLPAFAARASRPEWPASTRFFARPTTTVAPPHEATFDDMHWPGFGWLILFNLTGWPAAVVRAGFDPRGLPVGIQIAAPPRADRRALNLAGQIEDAAPR